ncbi:C-type lectin protein [Ranid herpesvirus 3]|uniref:C-type lectin protein n=1 Tax=Ranid herpesvirus 3 TaxID=1987509 RepID=A0A1X9T5H2_9VIRU|nr:C-type lectin protein [Ranid herpesvirus 3]ARR28943.1 C-type lectin protein [Ranid herpesvirus 3]
MKYQVSNVCATMLIITVLLVSGFGLGYQLYKGLSTFLCPIDWIGFDSSCYLPSTELSDWNNAKKKCEEKGSSLLRDAPNVVLRDFAWRGVWIDGPLMREGRPFIKYVYGVQNKSNDTVIKGFSLGALRYICVRAMKLSLHPNYKTLNKLGF